MTTLHPRKVLCPGRGWRGGAAVCLAASVACAVLADHGSPTPTTATARLRRPVAAAFLINSPLKLLDDLAFGYGVWAGCISHRTLDPLKPSEPWRVARRQL